MSAEVCVLIVKKGMVQGRLHLNRLDTNEETLRPRKKRPTLPSRASIARGPAPAHRAGRRRKKESLITEMLR